MDLIDLLNSDVAELPFTGEDNLEQQLRTRFDAYLGETTRLSSDSTTALLLSTLADVRCLADSIVAALGYSLNAESESALDALDRGLTKVERQMGELCSNEVGDTGPMFRVRSGQLAERLSNSQMFHIPFEMRDRVATQRYSFPGLPCLYLGLFR